MSTCKPDGSWTSPIHFPRGSLLRPHVLETPDKGDMPCIPAPIPTAACKPLNLTYNPNEEDGAGFYCTPPIDWSNLPVRMSKPTVCYLVCNMMLVATVQCKEGVWTGHPEIGFWCNKKNLEEFKCAQFKVWWFCQSDFVKTKECSKSGVFQLRD